MYKTVLIFWLVWLTTYQLKAQQISDDFVPSFDTLQQSVRSFYLRKAGAELEEFEYRVRYRWLQYVPNVGWDAFRMSPIVSVNTSSIFQGLNTGVVQQARQRAIKRINEVAYNQDLDYIRIRLLDLQHKVAYYQSQQELLKLREVRFGITETGYKRKEVPPSEYYAALLEFNAQKSNLLRLYSELVELRNEILIRAHTTEWQFLYEASEGQVQ
jgi:hypothetical protein